MCSTEVGDLVVGEGERWMGKRQVLDKTLKVERIRPLWPGVGDGPRWDRSQGKKWQRCSEVELALREPRCQGGR